MKGESRSAQAARMRVLTGAKSSYLLSFWTYLYTNSTDFSPVMILLRFFQLPVPPHARRPAFHTLRAIKKSTNPTTGESQAVKSRGRLLK